MTQHTPGPWRICLSENRIVGPKTDSPSPVTVAQIGAAGRDTQTALANARLIAAAPELLEAVKRFLKCHDQDRDYSDMNWDAARAAIAKAEGSATP